MKFKHNNRYIGNFTNIQYTCVDLDGQYATLEYEIKKDGKIEKRQFLEVDGHSQSNLLYTEIIDAT